MPCVTELLHTLVRHTRLKFTDYLAIYAAILSTLVFLWNVLQSRPRIKVDLTLGIEGADEDSKLLVSNFDRAESG